MAAEDFGLEVDRVSRFQDHGKLLLRRDLASDEEFGRSIVDVRERCPSRDRFDRKIVIQSHLSCDLPHVAGRGSAFLLLAVASVGNALGTLLADRKLRVITWIVSPHLMGLIGMLRVELYKGLG